MYIGVMLGFLVVPGWGRMYQRAWWIDDWSLHALHTARITPVFSMWSSRTDLKNATIGAKYLQWHDKSLQKSPQ
jgi:hypothetical protein